MYHTSSYLLLAMMSASPLLSAQQLFTANESPAAEKLLSPRPLQYWVNEQGCITCVDGQNRFTRALYGSCTDGRLETSDLPEFGLYMPYMGGNIRFEVPAGARVTATYDGVSRTYVIDRLPVSMCVKGHAADASIRITALALNTGRDEDQGGVWGIHSEYVAKGQTLQVRFGGASNASFNRNGDLGVDRKDCFDFRLADCAGNEYTLAAYQSTGAQFDLVYGQKSNRGQQSLHGALNHGRFALAAEGPYLTGEILLKAEHHQGDEYLAIGRYDTAMSPEAVFLQSYKCAKQASTTIALTLPDKALQPLDYILSAATDAIWDEPSGVWQHGAIGWRMPLPGWRAGYVGDVMGLHERAERHFQGYAASQLVDVPVDPALPMLDFTRHLARSTEKVGAPMYTTGYIGRYPNNPTKVNHYDMNLVYIDELLWHLNWTGDWALAERYFPTIQRHLDWEKRCFDPDGDHLYDAYCCIWASDGLYYDGGAVTHSSAYNYRANLLASQLAAGLSARAGDPAIRLQYDSLSQQYLTEATGIYEAIDLRLWNQDKGVWAECQDKLGHQRQHTSPALWTIYHAIDSEIGSAAQRYSATHYVDSEIPRYWVRVSDGDRRLPAEAEQLIHEINAGDYYTLSTTNWQPYCWSINNVALAEEVHTALAYWQSGRSDEAYHLFKGALLDCMYLGASPGNIAQISFYDAARSECYRDFGDPVGITARTLVQGLFGVLPDLLHDRVVLRPGFPTSWEGQEIALHTADFSYGRHADGRYFFEGKGRFAEAEVVWDTIPHLSQSLDGYKLNEGFSFVKGSRDDEALADWPAMIRGQFQDNPIDLRPYYNLPVCKLFHQQYLSPRSQTITLSLPTQGIGEWCHPLDTFAIAADLGCEAVFTSLFDNFPDRIQIPVTADGKGMAASRVYLNMCGTTNAMQSRIANGVVRIHYDGGAPDSLMLVNPTNWWPIEQELVQGLPAFYLGATDNELAEIPLRMSLRTGEVYRPLANELNRKTDGGATMLLEVPVDPNRRLMSIEIESLSNDVIIGLISAAVR